MAVTFNVSYPRGRLPEGSVLHIRGSGCGLSWDSGKKLDDDGDRWTLQLSAELPCWVEVKVLLNDSHWQRGPNLRFHATMADDVFDIYPSFYQEVGRIEHITDVFSPQLGNTRDLAVYVPPAMIENTLMRLDNVLIMHDGQNLFEASSATYGVSWRCGETADALFGLGKMEPVLIVGVNNSPDRFNELSHVFDPVQGRGGKGNQYLDFIEYTVLPIIKEKYPRANLSGRTLGILGSSLGGLISCYAGWTRPNLFGRIGYMSIEFECHFCAGVSRDLLHLITERPAPTDSMFYVDSGVPAEGDGSQVSMVVQAMKAGGLVVGRTLFPHMAHGALHDEASWAKRLHLPFEKLYGPGVGTYSSE